MEKGVLISDNQKNSLSLKWIALKEHRGNFGMQPEKPSDHSASVKMVQTGAVTMFG
jgi:hypothetical protein